MSYTNISSGSMITAGRLRTEGRKHVIPLEQLKETPFGRPLEGASAGRRGEKVRFCPGSSVGVLGIAHLVRLAS